MKGRKKKNATKRFKLAADCIPCPDCGEPWCEECEMHYADCNCKGPHSDDDDDELD